MNYQILPEHRKLQGKIYSGLTLEIKNALQLIVDVYFHVCSFMT